MSNAEWDSSSKYIFCYHLHQIAMLEIIRNFPNRLVALKLRLITFPLGQHFHKPSDVLETEIARLIAGNTETRKRLIEGIALLRPHVTLIP